ncbi:hypothetical protein [Nonomuraea roseola]|uniref:glycine-rich domain-containing protein n=1 Tax=Nonomuraea roseola TaxID=46179 RepID=UPI0031F8D24D
MPTTPTTEQPAQADVIDPTAAISAPLFERLVARILADHPAFDDAYARRVMTQALAFLMACGANPGARLAPSPQVDVGWHTFILFTHDYTRFCHQVAGRMIHHARRRRARHRRRRGGQDRRDHRGDARRQPARRSGTVAARGQVQPVPLPAVSTTPPRRRDVTRLDWEDLPETVRAAIQDRCGAVVSRDRDQRHHAGVAARLHTEHGSVFLKAINADNTAAFLHIREQWASRAYLPLWPPRACCGATWSTAGT